MNIPFNQNNSQEIHIITFNVKMYNINGIGKEDMRRAIKKRDQKQC